MAQHEKFDINEASMEDLASIPGVGETMPQAIIDYRESHGQITDLDELAQAEQLNEQDIESLREWLTVGSEKPKSTQFWEEEGEEEEDMD